MTFIQFHNNMNETNELDVNLTLVYVTMIWEEKKGTKSLHLQLIIYSLLLLEQCLVYISLYPMP